MTLAELASLVGAEPKWVLNTTALLSVTRTYSLPLARRLAVARALNREAGIPLPRAWSDAARALGAWRGGAAAVRLDGGRGDERGGHSNAPVIIEVDVRRILAAVNVRLSRLRTMHAPRQRGRRPARRDPLRAAADWGLDLSLLRANLRRSPAERLRQLDAMARFRRRVRRVAAR